MRTQLTNRFSAQGTAAAYFAHASLQHEEEKTTTLGDEVKEDKAYICDKQCHKCKCLTKTSTL